MTDPTPPPVPPPTPKTKRPRSTVNRAHLDEIKNSRTVAKAALDPANTAMLAGVEFDVTVPAHINTLADSTEHSIGQLTGTRVQKKDLTAAEALARDALMAVILPIQAAAKRKYGGDHDTLRHAYFVGDHLQNDTLLEVQTASIAIRDRLVIIPPALVPLDFLPGIKATQITALSAAITTYATGVIAPAEQLNQNMGALNDIVDNVAELAGLRHQVQLAVEQAIPWRTPGVAATRLAFLLPADRPMVG